ncbi:MAG: component of SufBCD complex [Pseudorhodobacter sp.]|nr:component of SufBCD complex [Pseudorhodobacter sp.]
MQLYQTILELIDLRSFSNLWFWIALAVMWSRASHWVLGVPFDMVQRAGRYGGQAEADLQIMVQINIGRLQHISRVSGLWIAGFAAFVLTALVLLGFVYDIEFAQAVFCLAFPMTLVGGLSLRTADKIVTAEDSGAALRRRLTWHRLAVQGIGMLSILLTTLWGMWQNMRIGPW